MLKGISAIAAAAVCAGFVVGFVPPPKPAAAAATPRSMPGHQQGSVAANSAPVAVMTSSCLQTWPYYEQSCLRDTRKAGAPAARVIPSSYPVKAQVSKAEVSKAQVSKAEASKAQVSKAQESKIAKLAGGAR